MHFVTFVYVYNMHQDTKSARLIVVCKRTLTRHGDLLQVTTAYKALQMFVGFVLRVQNEIYEWVS